MKLPALVLSGATLFSLLRVTPAAAQANYTTAHTPLLGSAWYPEQWPESRWDADLTLMEQAHMNVVRVGEFAWSAMEPHENDYELDWLQRAIDMAARHHIAVVLGTPTDAPPVWLTTKYPETLGVDANGHVREHGNRRQFNYSNPKYRELCREIVKHLGERFGHNTNVIGWQIGNEDTDESFDAATRMLFQQFLRNRYGTLAELNQRWTTAYWSQTYTDWSQIPLEATHGNPGLLLEHKHFVTATWQSFQRNQIDVLKPLIASSQFITTNVGGLAWSDNWDHYALTADLNLASWDDYVGEGHLDAAKNAMLNDFARGWRRQNFWIMETQPASVNWAPINNALYPGETRALAWQAVGHGADAILYWQWRSALNGQEQYHGVIVGADGEPAPIYPEIQQIGEEFLRVQQMLARTSPPTQIALLYTYDSRWAIDFQQHTKEYDQQKVLLRFYTPLHDFAERRGQQIDIIDPTQPGPMAKYTLLVAPSLNVIDDALADKLLAWVRDGGRLLLGPRSGMKNAYNELNPQQQPGPLANALGAHVQQFYALDKSVELAPELGARPDSHADIWAEPLKLDSKEAHIEMSFGHDGESWLSDRPAMVTRRVGKGSITYLGTMPDARTLQGLLDAQALAADPSAPTFELPDGVELCVRTSDAQTGDAKPHAVYIYVNHALSAASISIPTGFRAVVRPALASGEASSAARISLPSQGVAVLTNMP